MPNPLNDLQKKLKNKSIPEYISTIPSIQISEDLTNDLTEIVNMTTDAIITNNEYLPFLTDSFGIGKKTNLQKIEALLRDCKAIEGDFFSDDSSKKVEIENNENEFRTAGGSTIGSGTKKFKIEYKNKEKSSNIPEEILEKIKNEIVERDCKVAWDDIVGLEMVKKTINEIVLWPMMRPDIFTGLRGPPKGLLLFGPPGTGKTMIGKCIASQCNATFFSISASSLTSKYVGEGEKMVRGLFHVAREMSPAVIFIDEIDSLLSQRSDNENEGSRRIKTEFLVQFDGAKVDEKDDILIIGATNRPHEIDEAARRRLVKRIYVPLPENLARQKMVAHLLKKYKNVISEEDLKEISKLTEGYSGSDLFNLCREATLEPLREIKDISVFNTEDLRAITINDFKSATQQIRKSVSKEDLRSYEMWNKDFGSMQIDPLI